MVIGPRMGTVASPGTTECEARLLASDEEAEAAHAAPRVTRSDDHFYVDTALDRGNLRVSTLYYPGRPQLV